MAKKTKKRTPTQKLRDEITRLVSELGTASVTIDALRRSIAQKDADHSLVLNEARRRTLPIGDMGLDANFLPEFIESIDMGTDFVDVPSHYSDAPFRKMLRGPAKVTIVTYGQVIVNECPKPKLPKAQVRPGFEPVADAMAK